MLHRLIEDGDSVIVIDQNLDLIAEADWVVAAGKRTVAALSLAVR